MRIATTLSFVIALLVPGGAAAVLLLEHSPPPWPVYLTLAIVPLLVGAIWISAHIRAYRLEDGELRVELPLRTARYALAGLESVVADRDALRGARKVVGNGGVRAITGRYRSRSLGRFQAFVTDPAHAVVLRWPDRCVVISPEQHSFFVDTVRRRAGLVR